MAAARHRRTTSGRTPHDTHDFRCLHRLYPYQRNPPLHPRGHRRPPRRRGPHRAHLVHVRGQRRPGRPGRRARGLEERHGRGGARPGEAGPHSQGDPEAGARRCPAGPGRRARAARPLRRPPGCGRRFRRRQHLGPGRLGRLADRGRRPGARRLPECPGEPQARRGRPDRTAAAGVRRRQARRRDRRRIRAQPHRRPEPARRRPRQAHRVRPGLLERRPRSAARRRPGRGRPGGRYGRTAPGRRTPGGRPVRAAARRRHRPPRPRRGGRLLGPGGWHQRPPDGRLGRGQQAEPPAPTGGRPWPG